MTMHRLPWFDRRFELGLPPEAFPYIVERVRGAPVRIRTSLVFYCLSCYRSKTSFSPASTCAMSLGTIRPVRSER